MATAVGNWNGPSDETVSVPATVDCKTSPDPDRPRTVPPIAYCCPLLPLPPPQLANVMVAAQAMSRSVCFILFILSRADPVTCIARHRLTSGEYDTATRSRVNWTLWPVKVSRCC